MHELRISLCTVEQQQHHHPLIGKPEKHAKRARLNAEHARNEPEESEMAAVRVLPPTIPATCFPRNTVNASWLVVPTISR
jgi:hypothetical protein